MHGGLFYATAAVDEVMTSPGTGALRGARAFVLAAAIVGLSTTAHQLAGGADPGAVPLVALAALTVALVRPLTLREARLPTMLALLGAGQVALHFAFEWCAELARVPAGVHHHGSAASGASMLAAHLVATLAVALVLRHGEIVLWRLWAWLTKRRILCARRVLVVTAAACACGALLTVHAAPGCDAVRARAPPVPA